MKAIKELEEPKTSLNSTYPINRWVEFQAQFRPHTIAISCGEEQLSYGELNARANKLARELQKQLPQQGQIVAILMNRSSDLIVAMLAILKSGNAYLPLDLSYPRERLHFMIEDADASITITEPGLANHLDGIRTKPLLFDKSSFSNEDSDDLKLEINPHDLAYIIYTSGSTGKPKGVMISHRNVVRLFSSTEKWFGFSEQDVWSFFHSQAFDFSVWEIWGALLYGGRIAVVPYSVSRNPRSFFDFLAKEQVSVLNQTPSAFRQLIPIAIDHKTALDHLRYVIFGGEALDFSMLGPWIKHFGDQKPRLINMYGITETTVHVTYRPIREKDLHSPNRSLIGIPIPDLKLYLLDAEMKVVSVGTPGEIYVGGEGVARGYLNRPELSQERFVPNPFAANTDFKLYRSGDLAKRLPDGDLEYLGRADQQVKIRGFRIESGEIETVIRKEPGIKDAIVTAENDSIGTKLVAYVISTNHHSPSLDSELRTMLKTHLPDYMIPSCFVPVEAFPLTANGKLDRHALTQIRLAQIRIPSGSSCSSSEKDLIEILEKLLSVKGIGVHDNLIELGCDSIRSIKFLALASQRHYRFSLEQFYENPTVSALAGLQQSHDSSNKSPRKNLRPFEMLSIQDLSRIPHHIEDAFPMARLQEGMLFHSELTPDSAVYHDIFTYDISFPFQKSSFEKALSNLIQRHPLLRACFDLKNYSEALHLIHQEIELPFKAENWISDSPESHLDHLKKWMVVEKKNSFDWKRPPLIRFFAFQTHHDRFYLAVSFHHAILDGWSLAAMLTELLKEYVSLCEKKSEEILPVHTHYRDYIFLERQAIQSSETPRFWKKKLENFSVSTIPRWPQRLINQQDRQGSVCDVAVSLSLFEKLTALSKSTSVPLRSVLLAAHCRVISFLSGQQDIVTGIVMNGRPETEDADRMIGEFLNTLPIRINLDHGSWIDFLHKIFSAEKELIPHRRFPMTEIQRALNVKMLFEMTFDFVQFHVYRDLQHLSNRLFSEGMYFEANNFPLLTTFALGVDSSELRLILNYDGNEFSEDQIKLISQYYIRCLEIMVEDPSAAIDKVSFISTHERKQLLEDWNHTQAAYSKNKCIHELVEEQTKRTPEACAVALCNQTLSYKELNDRANQLAHHLTQQGLKPNQYVGVLFDRSIEMIIALLGILKAGGAYVPLEPTFPKMRIQWILDSLSIPFLVTHNAHYSRVKELSINFPKLKQIIFLDEASDPLAACSTADLTNLKLLSTSNPSTEVTSKDLAYIIFTSGSTGTPKGVMIHHYSVINLIEWVNRKFKVGAHDRLLFITSLTFDLSVYDIFGILAAGGCIHVATKEDIAEPERLVNLLRNENITFWDSAPAALQQLLPYLQSSSSSKQSSLRLTFLSGDWVPLSLPNEIRQHFPHAQVIALGGATEATIWSNYFQVTSVKPEWKSIPYGRPIQNAQYFILDDHLHPLPVGIKGHLYIGGDCLSSGYVHAPDLTAERFIDAPFPCQSSKIYKTGDVARFLPDGNIEFLGRADSQVKIRGFRIELTEIEQALRQHPLISDAVVAAMEDKASGKQLRAYLVSNSSNLSYNDVKSHLRNLLPDYMVPTRFALIDKIPATANGKIDRLSLSNIQLKQEECEECVHPRTDLEFVLLEVWKNVLRTNRTSIHDNFFDLGGHSLLATQVVTKLRDFLKIKIPLRKIFDHPTIAQLAEELYQDPRDKESIDEAIKNLTSANSPSEDTMFIAHQQRGVLQQ